MCRDAKCDVQSQRSSNTACSSLFIGPGTTREAQPKQTPCCLPPHRPRGGEGAAIKSSPEGRGQLQDQLVHAAALSNEAELALHDRRIHVSAHREGTPHLTLESAHPRSPFPMRSSIRSRPAIQMTRQPRCANLEAAYQPNRSRRDITHTKRLQQPRRAHSESVPRGQRAVTGACGPQSH